MGRRKLVRILLEYGFTSETDTSKSNAEGTNISALNLQHEKAIASPNDVIYEPIQCLSPLF